MLSIIQTHELRGWPHEHPERANDPSKFSYVSVSVIAGGGATLLDQAGTEKDNKPIDDLGDRAIQECVTVAKDVLSKRG